MPSNKFLRSWHGVAKQITIREGTFFIWGGGLAGSSEGRVISKFFTNWGGSNLFYLQPGEGHSFFFGKERLFHVA